MGKLEIEKMITMAMQARENAYVPYSHFQVGACLLSQKGDMYTGCNIENASYSGTNCAERTAFFKAVSEGEREFKSIVIVGGKKGESLDWCPPCGICRQVMSEFCDPEKFQVILAKSEKEYQCYFLKELLPLSFGKQNLES